MDKSIHSVDQNLEEKTDRIIELESNMMSINNQVSEINQDNVNRREELARLQVDS
jgi:septation ring formation regulator EzrA